MLIKFSVITSTIFISLSGWLTFTVRLLYSKWESFYLLIQRIKFVIMNPDTKWNMTVRFECEMTFKKYQEVKELFLANSNLKNAKFIPLISGDVEIRAEGIIFQITTDENELEIHIVDLPVTYDKSLKIIEELLSPIFDDVENVLAPKSKTYFLNISFDDTNPYYGLYLNKIPKGSIINFDVKFLIDKSKVQVSKDSITLTAPNKAYLTSLTRSYLSLSPKKSL